jgi:hypothetical protein
MGLHQKSRMLHLSRTPKKCLGSSFTSDEKCGLLEPFRERDLHLIPFHPDGTAVDGDNRIFRSFAGLNVESPSVPRTFDDVAF